MTKLYLSLALALGLSASACVDEDTTPVPPTQDEDEGPADEEVDPNVPTDPPGENVPGKGDCGGAQLQDDESCTPQ